MILELRQVGRGDGARVGGKGASLGELLRAGLDVPNGFVLTAAAYREAVAAAGLGPALARALAAPGVAEGDAGACETASKAIRPLFEDAWVAELDEPLARHLSLLGAEAVAVRSSATAEDLPDASFAGQQETFLGVRGLEEVKRAVRRCWASLWTPRAISYRARQGYAHDEVALAVVVQELLAPDAAGVLFTVNPVTGSADELVLDASWGLGEAVVSGLVTPDSWRLGRRGPFLREARVGAKERRVDAAPGGGTRVSEVPAADRARLCLGEDALRALAELGVRAERHFGAPQDVEFAWCRGRAVLLQSRPVTTHAGAAPPTFGRLQRRTLDDILEHYPVAPLPLDEEAVVDGYEALQEMLRQAGARLPHAREVLCMDGDGVTRVRPPRLGLGPATLRLPAVVRRAWREEPAAWRAALEARERAVHDVSAELLDDAGLVRRLREAVGLASAIARARFALVLLPMALWGAWLGVLGRVARHRVEASDWLGGLSYRTVEVERALQVAADAALACPAARRAYLELPADEVAAALGGAPGGASVLAAVGRVLEEHGARTPTLYVPFSARSWAEEPAAVHALLAAMVRAGEPGAAMARTSAAAARHEAEKTRVRARLPWFLRATFERTVERYRRAHVAREESVYAIERAFAAARAAARELGARLSSRGVLAAPGHVVFARLEELEAAVAGAPGELRRRVGRRRARRELAVATWRAQRAVRPASGTGAALEGVAGSPGVAEGPVRVVQTPEDFSRLRAGDVLVCPYTDPTWTPLFGLASAIVADTGGPLSHAAIVAREYGIPAVLGTAVGTSALVDDERVVVDGSAGSVRRA